SWSLIAALCGLAVLSTSQVAQAGDKLEIVTVLVAKKNIDSGTKITDPEKFFKPVRYVKGDEPRGYIGDLKQLKNYVVKRALAEDQPVKYADIGTAVGNMEVVPLPAGFRAYAIKVTAANGVLPGSRVDVALTVKAGQNKTVSKVILQNVLVIAVD